MATTTYEPIQSQTLGSTQATVTFSSIPQGYTDLVLVIANVTAQIDNVAITLNGDTGSNYSRTILQGNGSTASSSRNNSQSYLYTMYKDTAGGDPVISISQFQNYSNTNIYKTVLTRQETNSSGTKAVQAIASLWRNTSAITTILLTSGNANFNAGSIFTLYGIADASVATGVKATGGIITYDDTYYYHTFGASGTFTPKQSLTADLLVVAGGGGGGGSGGGGGAGGLVYLASQSLTAQNYTCTIGAGGSGGLSQNQDGYRGSNGANSQFGSLTAAVGGGGGGGNDLSGQQDGNSGGSGGGGGSFDSTAGTGGAGTSSQGNAGGNGSTNGTTYRKSGGGGGAGAAAANAGNNFSTDGGAGLNTYSSWASATGTGVSGYYAGGGGASPTKAGGLGGGGAGSATGSNDNGTSGVVNTGGGGGASGFSSSLTAYYGGAGGSGIVIIRYTKA